MPRTAKPRQDVKESIPIHIQNEGRVYSPEESDRPEDVAWAFARRRRYVAEDES